VYWASSGEGVQVEATGGAKIGREEAANGSESNGDETELEPGAKRALRVDAIRSETDGSGEQMDTGTSFGKPDVLLYGESMGRVLYVVKVLG